MSNRGLTNLLRTGGLTKFHVSREGAAAVAERGNPYPVFAGERYVGRFSAKESVNEAHRFEKKENREAKRKKGDDSDEGDSSSDDDGPHFKSTGIHAKGSDAGACPSRPFHSPAPHATLTPYTPHQTATARPARARRRRSPASVTQTRMGRWTRLKKSSSESPITQI